MCTEKYLVNLTKSFATLGTLESRINVRSGIMVRVGKFGQNNNSTVLNKHTGRKNFEVK